MAGGHETSSAGGLSGLPPFGGEAIWAMGAAYGWSPDLGERAVLG
jgi:hypothetical protein